MKLLSIHIILARTCGGLLDDFRCSFRMTSAKLAEFAPICLIGPNGSGKSQLMQLLAEIFQSACHAIVPNEERDEANSTNLFEVEYLICPSNEEGVVHVRLSRKIPEGKKKSVLTIERLNEDVWVTCELNQESTARLLPTRIVGYTSGDNETLSLPFLISRGGYADQVGRLALSSETRSSHVPDTRLMLIDYGTNLEVLVANLLLGNREQRDSLLREARVDRLHSCRCIVQLNHPAAPKAPRNVSANTNRKGIQLTDELEEYLLRLQSCATCYSYDEISETYYFDFWINEATREAFRFYWPNALELYRAFHKLAMLNDLAIPKRIRQRVRKETKERRFATRLPEPPDDDKVFRFEQVKFISKIDGKSVDYVSLSDGEHQLGQLLGMLMMQDSPGILFLLDEPESHFNPQWRSKCVTMIRELPTNRGRRSTANSRAAEQEYVLTTHAPFIPSDMPSSQVFIFQKEGSTTLVRHPAIETYGATFDSIIEECFDVMPPISKYSHGKLEDLRKSTDPEVLEEAIKHFGHSVEKALLIERMLQLREQQSSGQDAL